MGLFDFFKKSNGTARKEPVLEMTDMYNNPLQEGDTVEAMRYDLGRCKVVKAEKGFEYESLATGQRVSYLRMVDAITGFQKVKKVVA
jgi:hypothetical protein